MAKIKYSALVSDMRGKLNGSVASKNRFGSYFRNKVTPVNPQSSYQQNARARFGSLSSEFKDLSPQNITAWNEAAKGFPVTNIFGDQVFLTGQMLFNRLNGNLVKVGLAKKISPPELVSFPALVIDEVVFDPEGSTAEITLLTPTSIPADMKLVVYATRPMPATRSFMKNEYRMLNDLEVPFVVTGNSIEVKAAYAKRFGFNDISGQKIGFRVALVSTLFGQQSVPSEFVAISKTP